MGEAQLGVLMRGMSDMERKEVESQLGMQGCLWRLGPVCPWTLEWCSHWGICSSLQSGIQCFPYITCGKSARIGSNGDAPGK